MPSWSLKRIGTAALGAATIAVTIALPAAAGDGIGFALDWVVNGTHAGYFVAQDKGYYGDAGLDVTLSRGFGSGDTVKRVAAGTATFGLADTGAIIAAEANEEVPIRIVAMIYDRASLGVIYLAESGIKNPKDLEGRKIGRSASGASVNMFPGFLKANNIDRSKIREVVVDGANFLPMLMSAQVDAVLEQSIIIGKFRRIATEQGKTALAMRYSDFGLEAYGNAILTHPTTLQDKPDLVRRFVKASLRGVAYAFDHPEEAIAIMRKTNPEVAADSATDELVAMREIETTDEIQRVGLGHIDRTRMEKTRDIITSALSLKRSVPLEEIYSADFLPGSPIVHSGK
jgi:NitT/TauT family transport system substrate-binding protein